MDTMSLRDFHIVFISSAIMVVFGFVFWCFKQSYMTAAFVSMAVALGLIGYEINFIKKIKG